MFRPVLGPAALAAALGLALAPVPAPAAPAPSRTFEIEIQAVIGPLEVGRGPVHVFVPLPVTDEHQRVIDRTVEASVDGEIERDGALGNEIWHATVPEITDPHLAVRVVATVERDAVKVGGLDKRAPELSERERQRLARWLEPSDRVPVDAWFLRPVAREVRAAAAPRTDAAALARAAYDWAVDNVRYDKSGTGWGQGLTEHACLERSGNCTDFHSLFLSLVRSFGIPARFVIGYPVSEEAASGDVAGYHCWAEFWLPGRGWVPVDASEASKDPARRDELFGGLPADRVRLTVGRDLDLGAGHLSGPINFLVTPHVEVAGQEWKGPVALHVEYRDAQAAGH